MWRNEIRYPVRWEGGYSKDDEECKDTVPCDLFTLFRIAHDFGAPCFDSGTVEWHGEEGRGEEGGEGVAEDRTD
jgi:hypothetical protein